MQVTDPWAVSLMRCVQGAAALIHSLAGEPRDEAVEWVLKYAQNAKVNYRVGGLTVLAALLDMPGGRVSLCCGRREMVRVVKRIVAAAETTVSRAEPVIEFVIGRMSDKAPTYVISRRKTMACALHPFLCICAGCARRP
jgi:hypothetical protein